VQVLSFHKGEAWPMESTRFPSGGVVETLLALEGHVTAHRRPLAKLMSAPGGHRLMPALEAADQVRAALALLVTLYQQLHADVALADGLGPVGSIGEPALRGRRMVLLSALGRLRDLPHDAETQARTRGWFVGRFQDIDDVIVFLHDELAKLMALVTRHRCHELAIDGSNVEEEMLYHAAVHIAQRAVCDLRMDRDLAHFVRAGNAMTDWPEIATAFREIDAVLGIHVDVEAIRVAHADQVREIGQQRLAPFVRPAAGPVNPRGRAPPARRR